MDYPRIYAAFIEDRRRREVDTVLSNEYTEKHHITPRALGGTDSAENLIHLTPEDHFFAHLLLAKIHGGEMWQALMIMSRRPKGRAECARFARRSRRHYGMARRNAAPKYAADMARRLAEGRGPMDSPEAKAKVSAAMRGRERSAEHCLKLSIAKKGSVRSEASRAKQSATLTGVKKPAEVGARISAALKGVKKSPEHVEKMRANATGRVASDATRAKRRAQSMLKPDPAFFRGKQHTGETKARMAAVYEAKRTYQLLYGVSPRVVTIAMINAAGIPIG